MNKIDLSIKNEPDIIILRSMISIYMMNNNFEAMYYINKIKNSSKLDIQGELLIHRIKLKTQKDVSKNSTIFNTDIQYMVRSYNTYNNFVKKVQLISENMNMFWKEMALQKPNFSRLGNLGFWVAEESEHLKHDFEEMEVTKVYRTQSTLLYIGYLSRVMNKDERGLEIKNLLSQIGIEASTQDNITTTVGSMRHFDLQEGGDPTEAQFLDDQGLNIDYVEEAHKLDKKGIVVCSGDLNQMGNIININDRIH